MTDLKTILDRLRPALLSVAADIENGSLRPDHKLGLAMTETGVPCCTGGHVLHRAGYGLPKFCTDTQTGLGSWAQVLDCKNYDFVDLLNEVEEANDRAAWNSVCAMLRELATLDAES